MEEKMKNAMRNIALVITVLLAVSLVSCGGKKTAPAASSSEARSAASKTIRVVWWGSDERHKRTLEVIALFEKANPDIKVSPEYMGSDSYWDKLAVQVSGGTAPDVIQFGGNYPDYVAKDALLELNKYKGNLLDITNLDQDALELATMNQNLYGVCLGTNMLCLVYNKTLLENSGAPLPKEIMTWEELRAYCLSIAPSLPKGVFPMTDNCSNQANYFVYFMRQNNTPVYRNGTSSVSAEDAAKWVSLWEGFRADKIIPDAETTSSYADTSIDSSTLIAGKAAISLIWSNQFGSYQNATEHELGIILLPSPETYANWIMPSQYLCVNKKSANPDAAMAFINFFVNNPDAGKILGNDRGISISSVVREAIGANSTPADQKLYDYYAVATTYTKPMDPNLPNDQEFINTFKLIHQRVTFGQLTVAQGGEEIYKLIQRLLVK
jgi:multiple sugar transport system substrate-binding protein